MQYFLIYLSLIAFLIVDCIRDKRKLSPIKIFNGIWLLTLSLYNLRLSTLQNSLSPRTLQIFLYIILAFNVAAFISTLFSWRKKRKANAKSEKANRTEEASNQTSVATKLTSRLTPVSKKRLLVVNVIFVALFIIECIYSQRIPLISLLQTGDSGYITFGIPSLNGALNGLAVCMGAYYLFKKGKAKYIYLLFGALTVSRQVLLSMIIEGIFFSLLERSDLRERLKKISRKTYVILGVITILAFGFIGNLRSGDDTMRHIFKPRAEYCSLSSPAMWAYSYTTFSVANFDNLVRMTSGGINHGLSTLGFFTPTVLLDKISGTAQNFQYYVSGYFNASTAFPEIYLDFGVLGLVIFSALIGFLGVFLYKRHLSNSNIKNNLLYAVFLHDVVLIFFANMFLYVSIFAQFIYIPLIFKQSKGGGNERE